MNNIRLSIEDLEVISKIKYKLQSLQQPKYPIGFECEMEPMNLDEIKEQGKGFLNTNTSKPKTTTNSQSQTILEGKYIYEN